MADNKNLKLRFKLKELEFEIEGNENTVKDEFENFKSFFTNDILPQINKVQETEPSRELNEKKRPLELQKATDVESQDVSDFPVIKEVVHKDLPNGEQEWVLIYCFYSSNFGKESFTRKDIIDMYDSSNRKTQSNVNGLSVQLQRILKKEYIKFLNDTEYIMKPEGIKRANLILEGKSTSKASQSRTKSKASPDKGSASGKKQKSTKKAQGFKLDRNLNLRPEGKQSIKDFSEAYQMDKTPERILIIVYYLKEILGIDAVNADHIYTAFDKLNIRVPKSLHQLISDTKNKSGWLEFDSMDDIQLSIQGGNAVKYDLIKSK
ncbi:MAG: hypothetical protein AAF363_17985 [Bacteroidota bacterium]